MQNIKDWSHDRLEKEWLDEKKPIAKQDGFSWKGARPRLIADYGWARQMLRRYHINSSTPVFKELVFRVVDGHDTLVFVEYSANDMW